MKKGILQIILFLLCCVFTLFPSGSQAGTVQIPGFYASVIPPSSNALPVLKPGGLQQGISGITTTSNTLVINQNQPQAIIDWSSFNIGAGTSVYFNQQGNTSWAALNRIWSLNPSLIFGTLKADGKIYLINQNGILFGPGSQINVYALVASALNIKNSDFIKGSLNFYVETGTTTDDVDLSGNPYSYSGITYTANAAVSNIGTINAATGGSVFLIGPTVENYGSINAPIGQIGLAAGTLMELDIPTVSLGGTSTATQRTALIVDIEGGFGNAINGEGGQLTADMGLVGMYGGVVNQDGLIRSVTAVNQQGQIELIAQNSIITGSNSITESPISTSSATSEASPSSSFGGVINMHGNFANPEDLNSVPTGLIELNGNIYAPSGSVTLNAGNHVFLASGSSIDVSGVWSNETAAALALQVQLNSVELADAYGQKGGILQGATITVNLLTGCSIGNISSDILAQQQTAQQQAINGGSIIIEGSSTSDIIIKQGATLNFSGGGINYSGGYVDSTKLVSGGKIYDISNAPLYLTYDQIIEGVGTYVAAHKQGGNAGSLNLAAGTIVLDGQLDGSATRGIFQNAWTPVDLTSGSAYLLSVAQGLQTPRGGTLIIGNPPPQQNEGQEDALVQAITVSNSTDTLASTVTVIPAGTINAAGLSSLSLYADTTITIDSGAQITLSPGGNFTAYARRIEDYGSVSVPAGQINLILSDYLPADAQLTGEIFLGSGSSLDVSGQKIDNTLAGNTSAAAPVSGQISGGSISIEDQTDNGQGVFISGASTKVESGKTLVIPAAVVDVSGGYVISPKGSVTGGNAGSLTIQGTNIMLNGDLRGYALADANGKISGGAITINSTNISVENTAQEWPNDFTAQSVVPANMAGQFVLAGNRLDDTGFTQITLNSLDNININAAITPSLVRLSYPSSALQTGNAASGYSQELPAAAGRPDLIQLDDSVAFMAGSSSFTAGAGKTFIGAYGEAVNNLKSDDGTETAIVSSGSVVSTAPGGTINLSAPAGVYMAGTLQSPGGKINITTTEVGNVEIGAGGQILANGYNMPAAVATVAGLGVNCTPYPGGAVNLSAKGNILLDMGSLIDISGSTPIENMMKSSNGSIIQYQTASNPGSLSLTFEGKLTWDGAVNAQPQMAGIEGGALTINSIGNLLAVSAGDIQTYLAAGFDTLTLQSSSLLQFNGSINATVGQQLTLNAPQIAGSAGSTVSLEAPYIILTDTSINPPTGSPTSGSGQLALSSTGWIDLEGSINVSGFQNVNLAAARDIRLTELYSSTGSGEGQFFVAGDLTMQADRIYPTTLSNYNIYSTGKTTILPASNPVGGPIYSAGGNLTIGALGGIEIDGVLAAPMGTITLQNYIEDSGTSQGARIYLAGGSVVTTVGNTMVDYGSLDVNNNWTITNTSNNTTTSVSSDPQKSITVNAVGGDAVVMSNAQINTSGGGSIFAYLFQAGVEGTVDPLSVKGLYVVLSGNPIMAPGPEVYLEGGGGLSAGMYSLLPASYAFLPGAYILQVQSASVLPSQGGLTNYGYPLIVGYNCVANTPIRSTQPQVYSVMPAADVLAQGYYEEQTITAGNAGNVTIKGNTTIINGALQAAAMPGYQGGSLTLSGTNIYVQAVTATSLPQDFNYNTPVPANLEGELNVTAESLSGSGFQEINLGDINSTSTITIEGGTAAQPIVLSAPIISLAAINAITINSYTQLNALTANGASSGAGVINLTTPGSLLVDNNSTLHATNNIILNVNNVQGLQGNLAVDSGTITLQSSNIYFGGVQAQTDIGLYLTTDIWNRFTGYHNIDLVAANDIQFRDTFAISAAGSLTLDAPVIVGMMTANETVTVAAPTINLQNSGSSSTAAPVAANAGQILFNGNNINVGSGNVLFSGFSNIALNSQGDVTFKGVGSLTTGNADLQISAARITTGAGLNTSGTYQAADFNVYTGANYYNDFGINHGTSYNPNPLGTITITQSGGTPGTTSTPGGTLGFWGTAIYNGTLNNDGTVNEKGTIIQVDGGNIKLVAMGTDPANDGIFLHDGAQILVRGTGEAPGGEVTLQTNSGSIVLDAGSAIDVSAGAQGDAGAVTLLAPTGGVTIGGTLSGQAHGGAGGSFMLDTLTLDTNYIQTNNLTVTDMTNLIGILNAGGFTQSVNLRSRLGNIDIAATDNALTAKNVTLTADDQSTGNGQINIFGTIDASGNTGGQVELYAANDVNLQNGSLINVSGTAANASGGEVLLSSEGGYVNLNQGSVINASASGTGTGGLVHLRALRCVNDGVNDVQMNLDGTVIGVSNFVAEAFRVYDNVSTINAATITAWNNDNNNYMANASAIQSRLLNNLTMSGWGAGEFNLLPGIEARSNSNITLAAAVNLTTLRYGGEPGVLTLRAAGNLNINNNLVDHPTGINQLSTPSAMWDSWAYNLTAGADMTSADYMAVNRNGTGNLTIGNQELVYTEGAPIRFATGGDTVIGQGQNASPDYMINDFMSYNLASYSGSIEGTVGQDLQINGGAIQTATGDINITVDGNLILTDAMVRGIETLGAIRTTGWSNSTRNYYTYAGGGNISLNVGGNIGQEISAEQWTTSMMNTQWDYTTKPVVSNPNNAGVYWSASYGSGSPAENPTAGLATMGGGNLDVRAGGDFLTQAGTFGQNNSGDLVIYAGGDVIGRFLNTQGRMEINAMGNFGTPNQPQVVEAFDSQINITAQGNIYMATVVNPLFAETLISFTEAKYMNLTSVNIGYSENTSVNLTAGGDVTIGYSDPYLNLLPWDIYAEETLPPTLNITAGGDILVLHDFALLPSPTGNLSLIAGGSISGLYGYSSGSPERAKIYVSDISPANVYNDAAAPAIINDLFSPYFHAPQPVHEGDTDPVVISAGQNIENIELFLPKKAEITAEDGDISGLYYFGQNINSTDVSEIAAIQGNINFSIQSSDPNPLNTGVVQAGPGTLFIQAGGSITLGNAQWVQTVGGSYNPILGTKGSDLIIIAGYNKYTPADIENFFDTINTMAQNYTILMDAGQTDQANELLQQTKTQTVAPMLSSPSGSGNIEMTSSQISTTSGKDNIYIIAAGELDVGKSTFFNNAADVQKTGIFTAGGGAINILTNGDVNVNESRVMTFEGGDITVWSESGNINAGRGAKEEVIASPPTLVADYSDGVLSGYQVEFTPPAVGSGIRAVTFSPTGPTGQAPPEGDIYLFAISGIIDAGEAGISGGKVVLAATQVLNVGNISSTSGSVGVPSVTTATTSLGSLSGSGSATQNSQMLSSAAGIGAAGNANASQMLDDVMTKWLDVKVIDFILDDEGGA
ncbi:MAG: filamentous haemagglutinin family protein [Smithella sp.]